MVKAVQDGSGDDLLTGSSRVEWCRGGRPLDPRLTRAYVVSGEINGSEPHERVLATDVLYGLIERFCFGSQPGDFVGSDVRLEIGAVGGQWVVISGDDDGRWVVPAARCDRAKCDVQLGLERNEVGIGKQRRGLISAIGSVATTDELVPVGVIGASGNGDKLRCAVGVGSGQLGGNVWATDGLFGK